MTEIKVFSSAPRRVYRIRIEGALDPNWSDRLGGLAITSSGKFGSATKTVLEGELQDQSSLLGVLNTLYELHLPLEAVELLESDPAPSGRTDEPTQE